MELKIAKAGEWPFFFLKENREIYGGNAYDKLESDIKKDRKIYCPILVGPPNDQGLHPIFDGQHRAYICKENNYEVPYVINHDLVDSRILHRLNNTGAKWGITDFIGFENVKENDDIVKLVKVLNLYSKESGSGEKNKFTPTMVAEICYMGFTGNVKDKMERELYSFDEDGLNVLDLCLMFQDTYNKFSASFFCRAIKRIFRANRDLDKSRLINVITPSTLPYDASDTVAKHTIVDLYNEGIQDHLKLSV